MNFKKRILEHFCNFQTYEKNNDFLYKVGVIEFKFNNTPEEVEKKLQFIKPQLDKLNVKYISIVKNRNTIIVNVDSDKAEELVKLFNTIDLHQLTNNFGRGSSTSMEKIDPFSNTQNSYGALNSRNRTGAMGGGGGGILNGYAIDRLAGE